MTTTAWDRETAALRALLRDLAQPSSQPRAEECEVFLANLDLFVSDELDGVDVRQRHARAWRHLQQCPDCREEHDRLFALLAAEMAGRLPTLPPRRAAPAATPDEPWRLEVAPALDRARPTLQFIFAPAYLRQSLRSAGMGGVRAADGPPADRLLLSYLGAPAGGEVMVQLYARSEPEAPADALRLALIAAGEPMPTAAELTWGGRSRAVALGPDGEALIGPVSASDLLEERSTEAAPDAFSLRLLF